GGSVLHRYQTDFEYPFRQESNFLYLTGAEEPDLAMILDCGSGRYTLVVPRRDTHFAVWMGYVQSPSEYQETFQADEVIYHDDLPDFLKKRNPETLHCLPASEQAASALGYPTETGLLQDALAYCRVIKSEEEIALLKQASAVASRAHISAMQAVCSGTKEFEVKAAFDTITLQAGMLNAPYNGIFASGPGSAILHYTGWSRKARDGELFLIDAGAEFQGYAADITRTMPVNGRFSPVQAPLYDIVLEALLTASHSVRPGVKMEDLHLDAARVITDGLRDYGLITGSTDDLMDANVFALFFPHGLGHFLGLDTHDVGGYPKGTDVIDRPGLRFLRARRTLEEHMVLTIEPGLYFIPALLLPALEDPKYAGYLVRDKIEKLLNFGGIRIEDNLIVRKYGSENLTTVPRTREEIEYCMTGR
ncbi:aminopeptidase P family protein, partial [Balneolaceae bacterium ANBcel3]|nr:aminopeptidase P family protein [Balneolaceae bacterium ANBcel3]